jgi:ATP-binding cassette subfamily A (ABC1) protein 3
MNIKKVFWDGAAAVNNNSF